jgi:zinc transporter, ZIP family
MIDNNILLAFALTTCAGLATGIGSALAFFTRTTNTRFLSAALGFSGGVMIYVSFMEILPKALADLALVHGEPAGTWYTVLAFFGGILLILIIDRLVPSVENPHEARLIEEMAAPAREQRQMLRMGKMTALAIAIHNFPEGLVTFVATLSDPALGVTIALAIAIHNVPEGIAIAVPIYFATGSRRQAFWLSFLSGLAEPLGALLGFLLLASFFSPTLFGLVFAAVAGIMVFISLDELLPTARKYDSGHHAVYGTIAGMAVMAFSLLLFL